MAGGDGTDLAAPAQAGAGGRWCLGAGGLTVAGVQAADPFALAGALGALSMSDVESMGEDAAQAVIAAAQRVVTAVQARSSVALVALAERVQGRLDAEAEDFRAHTGQGTTYQSAGDEIVPSMVAPVLRVASRTAASRLAADHALVGMRGTLAAYWAGDLERHRADTIIDHALGLPARLRHRYEARVLESTVDPLTGGDLPISATVRDMARSTLARRAAKIAREVHPDCTREQAQRARRDRMVRAWADQAPGSTRWEALLPAETSAKMWCAIDALAAQYARANPGLPIDAARADALADLVLAKASVTTTLTLLIPALPLHRAIAHATGPAGTGPAGAGQAGPPGPVGPEGGDESRDGGGDGGGGGDRAAPLTWILAGAAEDPRVGALLPETVAAILADPATLVRLARLDPDGSLATSPRTHDPGAALRRAVQTRDGTCRFPTCHTPARRCDLDHVTPFPVGLTEPANLAALCRTHHRFKHHGGWATSMGSDAALHWTTPDGRVYTTHPAAAQAQHDLGLTSLRPSTVPAEAEPMRAPDTTLIELAFLVEPAAPGDAPDEPDEPDESSEPDEPDESDGSDEPDESDQCRSDPVPQAPADWAALGTPVAADGPPCEEPPEPLEGYGEQVVHPSSPLEAHHDPLPPLESGQPQAPRLTDPSTDSRQPTGRHLTASARTRVVDVAYPVDVRLVWSEAA